MKELVELLIRKGIVFKSLKTIDAPKLKSRKKIDIYIGVDLKNSYCALFQIYKKSRFIKKDANEVVELVQRLETFNESKIKFRYIIIKSPICSKAKLFLEENDFKVVEKIDAVS